MEYKYVLLKTSWGIVVFLDMEEKLDFEIVDEDFRVNDAIYLRFDGTSRIRHDWAEYWMGRGLKDLERQIGEKLHNKRVCFVVRNIDFNHAHFQEEGLYCAVQGWIAKYYGIEIPEVEVFYDKQKNKYIFPALPNRG